MKIFITGSFFYDFDGFTDEKISTPYADVEWMRGERGGEEIIILPRHGKGHENLPNHINYLANFWAIDALSKTEKIDAIISFSVVGVLNKKIPLGSVFIPDDFYFPENRLPDGKICTVFQNSGIENPRGHLIPVKNFFHTKIQSDFADIFSQNFSGTYIHANGPRFNSKAEIKDFQSKGGDTLSQTCGPEIVMANELQIPFGMLCYTVDYANGVSDIATHPSELESNLKNSPEVFKQAIDAIIAKKNTYTPENFVFMV